MGSERQREQVPAAGTPGPRLAWETLGQSSKPGSAPAGPGQQGQLQIDAGGSGDRGQGKVPQLKELEESLKSRQKHKKRI